MLGTSNVKFTQPIYLYPLKYIGSIVDIYGMEVITYSQEHIVVRQLPIIFKMSINIVGVSATK